jgi:hypothetical protein
MSDTTPYIDAKTGIKIWIGVPPYIEALPAGLVSSSA